MANNKKNFTSADVNTESKEGIEKSTQQLKNSVSDENPNDENAVKKYIDTSEDLSQKPKRLANNNARKRVSKIKIDNEIVKKPKRKRVNKIKLDNEIVKKPRRKRVSKIEIYNEVVKKPRKRYSSAIDENIKKYIDYHIKLMRYELTNYINDVPNQRENTLHKNI